MKVITWETSRGSRINVCLACEERFRKLGEWPKDRTGEEYARVYRGLHEGTCSVHPVELS